MIRGAHRACRFTLVVAAMVTLACAAVAQPAADAEEGDRDRLRRERAERLRDLARGDRPEPGPVMQMWRGDVSEQMILVGGDADVLFIIRGHMLYRYVANPELTLAGEADLRTEEEVERAEEGGEGLGPIWPDPDSVPVTAEWAPASGTLVILRGGVLMQYSADLERLATFDLRTEREKQMPGLMLRMPGWRRGDDRPPPPPAAEAPAAAPEG